MVSVGFKLYYQHKLSLLSSKGVNVKHVKRVSVDL